MTPLVDQFHKMTRQVEQLAEDQAEETRDRCVCVWWGAVGLFDLCRSASRKEQEEALRVVEEEIALLTRQKEALSVNTSQDNLYNKVTALFDN